MRTYTFRFVVGIVSSSDLSHGFRAPNTLLRALFITHCILTIVPYGIN